MVADKYRYIRPGVGYELLPGYYYVVTNEMFGAPLYAWYIVEIEVYDDGVIQGTLMTIPFQFYGPCETFEDAVIMLQTLNEGSTDLDIPVEPS
jgi:hypothetical protein